DYFSTDEFNDDLYKRDVPDKWSVGEVICHCWRLLKYFRMISRVYNPPARMLLKLSCQSPAGYDAHMENIYAGETMKRSEERSVGKEWRTRSHTYETEKKEKKDTRE